jgi:hypothetical protein
MLKLYNINERLNKIHIYIMGRVGDYTLEFHPYHFIFFDGTKVQQKIELRKQINTFNIVKKH